MRCSQHRFDIVLEVFEDDETRAPKGPQDGCESALKTAENDDFARDILKKVRIRDHRLEKRRFKHRLEIALERLLDGPTQPSKNDDFARDILKKQMCLTLSCNDF